MKKQLDDKIITQKEFDEKRKPLLKELVAGSDVTQPLQRSPTSPHLQAETPLDGKVHPQGPLGGCDLLEGAETLATTPRQMCTHQPYWVPKAS